MSLSMEKLSSFMAPLHKHRRPDRGDRGASVKIVACVSRRLFYDLADARLACADCRGAYRGHNRRAGCALGGVFRRRHCGRRVWRSFLIRAETPMSDEPSSLLIFAAGLALMGGFIFLLWAVNKVAARPKSAE